MNELGARLGYLLDPEVAFLNHGSFGACPGPVLAHRTEFERRLEREPVRFFLREYPHLLEEARAALARFVGAQLEGLSFVRNATAGVNAVLRSIELRPGDELVTTDQSYNACRAALGYLAERSGARVVTVALPFPVDGEEALIAPILAAVGPRTRLVLFDHVTSPTGVVLPVAKLAALLSARGVEVLIDGAHAPGMLELDLATIGADYYVGNCHKWMCAPKGAGFLYVREDRREGTVPAALSHGINLAMDRQERHRLAFDWVGTDDPTPTLCVPQAIAHLETALPGGWPALRARGRALAAEAQGLLCEALGVARPVPPALLGMLASIPLPDEHAPDAPVAGVGRLLYTGDLQRLLLDEDQVEVPIVPWPAAPRRLVRVSAAPYNERGDYQRLAEALVRRLDLGTRR